MDFSTSTNKNKMIKNKCYVAENNSEYDALKHREYILPDCEVKDRKLNYYSNKSKANRVKRLYLLMSTELIGRNQ